MKMHDMPAEFDGRPEVRLKLRGHYSRASSYAHMLAHHFGYEVWASGFRQRSKTEIEHTLVFRRDDSPQTRERVAQTAHLPVPLPEDAKKLPTGASPLPVHAGGTWVSPGEAAEARWRLGQRSRLGPVPLVTVLALAAGSAGFAAWHIRHDSVFAGAWLSYLAAVLVAAAALAPTWLRWVIERDVRLLERYDQQRTAAAGVPPPPPPPPAPGRPGAPRDDERGG